MAEIPDLSPCDYFPFTSDALVAVGWLGKGSDYAKGAVARKFIDKLRDLLVHPWQPVISPGLHECELCQFNGPCFSKNVFVPFSSRIYVAPEGIGHYIEAHWYKPPNIFIQAVAACPKMNSMAYKKSLLKNGGRELVSWALGA